MADGFLRIKTKIDNSEVDAGMNQLTKELATAERSADLLYQKFNKLGKQLKDMPTWRANTPEYTKLTDKVAQAEVAFERAGDKASKMKAKIEALKTTSTIGAIGSVKKSVDGIGTSIGATIKKVLRWGGAIVGVSSAYFALRSVMSTLTNYNDQMKADLDYMKYAVAMTFAPLIEAIVSGMYKLLQIVNAISMKLFNFNLFGKAGTKNFMAMNKGAEKLNKTMAGFDEMNVIADQTGAGAGPTKPSIDLSATTKVLDQVTKVMTDTINFWEKDWKDFFNFFGNQWDLAFNGFLVVLEGFYNFFKGIWTAITGLWNIIVGLFTGDIEKMKQGFSEFLKGIDLAVAGLLQVIIGLLGVAIGILFGILATIALWIYNNVIVPVRNFFTGLWDGFKNGAVSAWEGIKSVFSTVATFFGDIFGKAWNGVKNIFSTGGKIFDGIKDGIVNAFKAIVNTLIKGINFVVSLPFKAINGMLNTIRSTNILGVEPFKKLWDKNPIGVPQIPQLATGGIVNRPTRAIIGEAGPERVIPLSQDAEWISKVAEAFASKTGSSGTVNVYLDGRLIQKHNAQITEELSFVRNR